MLNPYSPTQITASRPPPVLDFPASLLTHYLLREELPRRESRRYWTSRRLYLHTIFYERNSRDRPHERRMPLLPPVVVRRPPLPCLSLLFFLAVRFFRRNALCRCWSFQPWVAIAQPRRHSVSTLSSFMTIRLAVTTNPALLKDLSEAADDAFTHAHWNQIYAIAGTCCSQRLSTHNTQHRACVHM